MGNPNYIKKSTLTARMLLVLMAFVMMVALSGFIMGRSLSYNLSRYADELMSEMAVYISNTLAGPEITLTFIADNIEDMLRRGEGFDAVQDYLKNASLPAFKENIKMFSYYTVYGYFDVFSEYENDFKAFYDGGGWNPVTEAGADWVPKERPWYTAAVEAGGRVVITEPYIDPATLLPVIAYTRLLSDADGRQLGVVGLDVPLDFLAALLGKEHIAKSGYSFLLDSNLQVIVHPHDEIIGVLISETKFDMARFLSPLERGENISLQRLRDYRGTKSLLFAHQIDNGWFICKVIPRFEYYGDLYRMLFVVGFIGAVLTAGLIYILVRLDKARVKAEEEIKQHANELAIKTSMLTALLDAAPGLIYQKDLNSNFVFCNKEMADFLEIAPEEIVGKSDAEVFGLKAEYAQKYIEADRTVINDKKIYRFEDPVNTPNGLLIFESYKAPLIQDGTVVGVVGVSRDITEKKKMEERLKSTIEQVEQASKAKSNFLSTMSHEMRTPMNAIIGMTAIGKKASDAQNKNLALEKIEDASSHLLGVINDILDMAKIEANKLELAPAVFNFEKMLQKVITFVNFRIDEKEQELTLVVDEKIPQFVFCDEQRLAQVIANLLSNAVKFTPEGGKIRFEATLTAEADGECELCVTVTDSGIGLSPEQHDKIFQPFEQAESGISRKYGGTGLGLVISKRITELMGGSIQVESELGKGAKFIFTVKVKRSEAGESTAKDTDNLPDNVKFTGRRLLIVEDVEINREILISLLEDTGFDIDCAENGTEALDIITKNPEKYDIVFMDVQMPKMDGLEATRRIRALPALQGVDLPVIAMTANVFRQDIEECYAAGMNEHIGKPIDIDRVLEVLRKYLK